VYGLPSGGLTSEGITSFHLGPYAKLGITDAVAIQLEALYSRRGANFEFEGLDEKSEIRLDYIDVPLLFVYNIVGENTWSFMVGPQASLLLTVKDGDKEIDKAQDYNSFDFSGVAGVQFGYKFLRVGARYNVGFLDVLKEQDGATDIGDGNYKNHFGQVYVGVEF
ncbi:MAG: PorT family protein, partial [Chitinophagaceae bacterium]